VDLKGRIPELDGIRGIAIAMVLAHHYFLLPIQAPLGTLPSYIQAAGRLAWSGVDLFFVLSGFLIGGILLDARDSTNYFRVFYARRFFRIVPIYFACLIGAATLGLFVSSGSAAKLAWMYEARLPWISYFFFLQNFWMAKASTYGVFGLGVTWSLAIEEQFYLTLPVLIRKLSQKRLLQAILLGIVLAPALRIVLHTAWPEHYLSWIVMMPCRADALLLGVLGAILLRDPVWTKRIQENRKALSATLVVLATGFVVLTKFFPNPYKLGMLSFGLSWLALFYLCILVYALSFRETWLGQCLRWRWLGWLGAIAYGTYLLHEFVRAFFFSLLWSHLPTGMSAEATLVSVLALLATLGICRASWLYFEKPLILVGHEVRYEPVPTRAAEALGDARG
jgi:peptidoglycan/LPS O-acetylase OafA/YrhL